MTKTAHLPSTNSDEEMLPVVDREGNLTGNHVNRSEAHQQGILHPVVHIWVYNPELDQVLLQLRSKEKTNNPSTWDISVGGHITSEQNMFGAVIAELNEEIGLPKSGTTSIAAIGSHLRESVLNNGSYIDNEFTYVFFVSTSWELDQFKINPAEVSEIQYFNLGQLPKLRDSVLNRDEIKMLYSHLKD